METITEQFERQFWLSATTVCKMFDIHRRSLARWFGTPKLGFPQPTRIRGRLYFAKAEIEIEAWVTQQRLVSAVRATHPKQARPSSCG